MRIPKTPPNWRDLMTSLFRESPDVAKKLGNGELQDLVRKANENYYHWDKLRFYPLPEGISHELLWVAVKLSRVTNSKSLDLSFDGNGDNLTYWLPSEHQRFLHRIDQQAGGTIGSCSALGIGNSADRFLFSSLMEEAIASSQLEGASTTRAVAKKMLREKRKPRTVAEKMIFNNYVAMLEIRDRCKDPLTPELLRDIQATLTHDTLEDSSAEGRFRNKDDDPVVVADSTTGDVIYTPPSVYSVERLVAELCEFANEEQEGFLHPVIKAIALHFSIGYIHPFCDGNGRTARAVFYWFMLRRGYWLFEFLPISRILLEGPVKYSRAYLYTETDQGDLTYFIHSHLIVIDRALDDLHAYLEQQQQESQTAMQLLKDASQGVNYRQRAVVQQALKRRHMTVTIQEHATEFGVSQATARADLFGLESLGLLRRSKQSRKWVFHPVASLSQQIHTIAENKIV